MKKILIISSNRLGDSILSSGIIDFFKKKVMTPKLHLYVGLYLMNYLSTVKILIK